MVYYYSHFRDEKTKAAEGLPKVTDITSAGGRVCIHFYMVPKPMLLTILHISPQDGRGSSSKGKSLKQARGELSLREIPGPRELHWPRGADCQMLVVRGTSPRDMLPK